MRKVLGKDVALSLFFGLLLLFAFSTFVAAQTPSNSSNVSNTTNETGGPVPAPLPAPPAVQSVREIPTNISRGLLKATVTPLTVVCADNPCIAEFNISVENMGTEEIAILFAERERQAWVVRLEIGNLSAGESGDFLVTLRFSYPGTTTRIGAYALLSDTLLKKEFTIAESWEKYEKQAKDLLFAGGFIIAPIIALALILIIVIVARSAERRPFTRHPGEFTMQNLFRFPSSGSRPERLALSLSNPFIWFTIVFFSLILLGSLVYTAYSDQGLMTVVQITLLTFVTALVVPLILMVAAWYGDIYEREPFRFVVAMFMWGILAAFLSFFVNGFFLFLFSRSDLAIPALLITVFGSIVISPVVEEILKALGIAIMSFQHDYEDTLDGLLYGFAVGVGFSVMENWFYFSTKIDPFAVGLEAWVSGVLYRSFFNTLAHGFFTGFVGAMIGAMKARDKFKDYAILAFVPGIFVAILLHIIFNLTAFVDVISTDAASGLRLYNPSTVLIVAIAFIAIYVYGLRESKARMGGWR